MPDKLKFLLSFIFLLLNITSPVNAIDITLQWVSNNDANLAGYRVFYREENQPYNYAEPYWESIDPVCTIYDLDETNTYYFVVRAFDANGLESADSNEVCLIQGISADQPQAENSGGGGSGCFIATAAYGSLAEPHVKILRNFRDRFLITNTIGKSFVRLYYQYSPPFANLVAKHDILKRVVRITLFPLVGISWVALKFGLESTIALMFIFGMGITGLTGVAKKLAA